ncbi:hypothetical protein V8D89_005232 [Ganoderma adspersum]
MWSGVFVKPRPPDRRLPSDPSFILTSGEPHHSPYWWVRELDRALGQPPKTLSSVRVLFQGCQYTKSTAHSDTLPVLYEVGVP